MKTYNLSKEDLNYLRPLESVKTALETQIKFYILNVIAPRLGLKREQAIRYNLMAGTIEVDEIVIAKDLPKEKKKK
jgi:hypothetical protein